MQSKEIKHRMIRELGKLRAEKRQSDDMKVKQDEKTEKVNCLQRSWY
jgi:hypothetical protein